MIQAAPIQNGEEIQENASSDAAFFEFARALPDHFRHVIVQYRHLPTGGW